MENDIKYDIKKGSSQLNVSKSSIKNDYIWNTLGSVMNAASSVILLFLTTRVVGEYWAGVFSLAYAIGQQFQTLGAFEMRPLQSTDVEERYDFSVYFASRILTVFAMMVCIIGYALVSTSKQEEITLIILVASLKLFDAFEDVFHGGFQQRGHLDVAGKAYFFRSLITTLCFIFVLVITEDLFLSCLTTIIVSIVALLGLNIPYTWKYLRFNSHLVIKSVFKLLKECLPLFVGAFLAIYLANAPKIGLDGVYSKEYQTYFAAIFMPALVINLLSAFVFRPLLTRLAQVWVQKKQKRFVSVLKRSLLWVLFVSIFVCILSWYFAIPVLNFIMGIDLSLFRVELIILVVGGMFNAASIILYYGLVIMRKQVYILIGYGLVAAFALFAVHAIILRWGMMGASLVYTISMLLVFLVFLFLFTYSFKMQTKSNYKSPPVSEEKVE